MGNPIVNRSISECHLQMDLDHPVFGLWEIFGVQLRSGIVSAFHFWHLKVRSCNSFDARAKVTTLENFFPAIHSQPRIPEGISRGWPYTLRRIFIYIKIRRACSHWIDQKKALGIRGSARIRSSVLETHTKTSKMMQIHSVVSENLRFCHGTFNRAHHFCSKSIDFLSKIAP